jgi:meso-butanediol dehydrogenase/(S,S)-butanediol dehydrogenase/diacetyl reductase
MLERRRGAIINVTSLAGIAADYTLTAYNAAMGGIANLSRSIALDYARKGIRCNTLCAGPLLEDDPAGSLPPDVVRRVEEAVPMGRMGSPDEAANLALFLAADESAFINGACCVCDGGLTAHSGMTSLSGVGPVW